MNFSSHTANRHISKCTSTEHQQNMYSYIYIFSWRQVFATNDFCPFKTTTKNLPTTIKLYEFWENLLTILACTQYTHTNKNHKICGHTKSWKYFSWNFFCANWQQWKAHSLVALHTVGRKTHSERQNSIL